MLSIPVLVSPRMGVVCNQDSDDGLDRSCVSKEAYMRKLPALITLTPAAVSHIQKTFPGASGVQVSLRARGCAGQSYDVVASTGPGPKDVCVEQDGVRVWIDSKAVLFVVGMEMGYEQTPFSEGFTFQNPNESGRCGCGASVMLTPVADLQAVEEIRSI